MQRLGHRILRRESSRFLSSSPIQVANPNLQTVVYSWGSGTQGEIGHSKFELRTTFFGKSYTQELPRKMLKTKRFSVLSPGEGYTLAVCNVTGKLFGWGQGDIVGTKEGVDGSLTAEPRPIPLPSGVEKVVHVSSGPKHAAIIDQNGLVYTWGNGGSWLKGGGQLGHNSTKSFSTPTLVESFAKYGAKASAVSCGSQHTLILTDDGEVLSCGVGEYGRLGTGSTTDSLIPQSLETLANEDIVAIAAGSSHSLALTANGRIYSWGRNDMGQLGQPDSSLDIYSMEEFPKLIDTPVTKNVKVKQIAATKGRSAAITECGHLLIWGSKLSHVPIMFEAKAFDGLKALKVVCGGKPSSHVTAVITEDHKLWTFGDAASGMLGKASGNLLPKAASKQALPEKVQALADKNVVDVFAGPGQHMMCLVDVT